MSKIQNGYHSMFILTAKLSSPYQYIPTSPFQSIALTKSPKRHQCTLKADLLIPPVKFQHLYPRWQHAHRAHRHRHP